MSDQTDSTTNPPPNNPDETKYINILLLGETGTGKSTFINAFVNYLLFASLDDAEEDNTKLVCLIPTKFSVITENGDAKTLNFKKDSNEDAKLGNSSTQATRAYVFPFDKKVIRIIDTPGINDSRGAVTKDRENFENILEYIGQFEHLHAVCFLMKPDVTVLTAAFKYCLVELLSRLDRSAANNIAFFFARTRSTNYKAPETITCVRRILKEIAAAEGVKIPLRFKPDERKNCFYFDNEGFQYLVAREQGVRLDNFERLQESWEVSYNSSWSFIQYIVGDDEHEALQPHDVQNTVSVNKARLLIFDLAKPLADISQLVQDNVDALKIHQAHIQKENITAAELREMLYVPVIDLQEIPLEHPVTICAASKCAEIYAVAGIQKCHYKQRCHNPCGLSGVPKNIIGDPQLLHCWAMRGTTNCHVCGCHFTTHMHVYYETKTVESRIEDNTVLSQLATNEDILKVQQDCVAELEKFVEEYQQEHKVISTALATFAYFLCNNSICPINDAYEAYLDCLIQSESFVFGSNLEQLQRYEKLKKEHLEEKRLLEEAGKMAKEQEIKHVTSDTIIATWDKVKKLPHTGKKVDTLHRLLVERKQKEMYDEMEYVHSTSAGPLDVFLNSRTKEQHEEDEMRRTIKHLVSLGQHDIATNLLYQYVNGKGRKATLVTRLRNWFSNLLGRKPSMPQLNLNAGDYSYGQPNGSMRQSQGYDNQYPIYNNQPYIQPESSLYQLVEMLVHKILALGGMNSIYPIPNKIQNQAGAGNNVYRQQESSFDEPIPGMSHNNSYSHAAQQMLALGGNNSIYSLPNKFQNQAGAGNNVYRQQESSFNQPNLGMSYNNGYSHAAPPSGQSELVELLAQQMLGLGGKNSIYSLPNKFQNQAGAGNNVYTQPESSFDQPNPGMSHNNSYSHAQPPSGQSELAEMLTQQMPVRGGTNANHPLPNQVQNQAAAGNNVSKKKRNRRKRGKKNR